MRRTCLLLLTAATLCPAANVADFAGRLAPRLASRPGSVAVMSFTPAASEHSEAGRLLADRLVAALAASKGGPRVVTRPETRNAEAAAQWTAAPSSVQSAEVARKLGAGTVVTGRFADRGNGTVSIDAIILDAASGGIVTADSATVDLDSELKTALAQPTAAAPTSAPASASAAPPAASGSLLTVPAGATVRVRLIDPVSGKTAKLGKRYRASLDEALVAGSDTVAARQADVQLQVTEATDDFLALGLASIRTVDGVARMARSESVRQDATKGISRAKTGILGAAVGAAVGAAAGGGKGAAIGAAAGGGTGAAVGGRRKLELPSEMLLEFKLAAPVEIEKK